MKFREIVDEIREHPQMSKLQGFGYVNQRKYQQRNKRLPLDTDWPFHPAYWFLMSAFDRSSSLLYVGWNQDCRYVILLRCMRKGIEVVS